MKRLWKLGLVFTFAVIAAFAARSAAPTESVPYFPPPESQGGWRTLVTKNVAPSPQQKAAEAMRKQMGYALDHARKINLAAMTPRGELASTRYCQANPGNEYLVYQPKASEPFSVELKAGRYRYEWFDPTNGATASSGNVQAADGQQTFKAPFAGDAVLWLMRAPNQSVETVN